MEPNLVSNFDDEKSNSVDTRSIFQMGFPLESEEIVREMIEKERQHSPRDDYLKRLRNGDLDFNVRIQALGWIWKVSKSDKNFFFVSSVDSILTQVNNLMTLI